MNAQASHSRNELVREINGLKDQCVYSWASLPEPHRTRMITAIILLADAARAAAEAGHRFTFPHYYPYLGPAAG